MRRYIYRFIARSRLSIRRITRNVVLSDAELEGRANAFLNEIQALLNDVPNTVFVNMDETAVFTEILPQTIIDSVGVSNVSARVGSSTSDRVTAVLSVCSNGDKLVP